MSKQWPLYHLCITQLFIELLFALQTIKITAVTWVFVLFELLRALKVEGSLSQLMVCSMVSGSACTLQASLVLEYLCWMPPQPVNKLWDVLVCKYLKINITFNKWHFENTSQVFLCKKIFSLPFIQSWRKYCMFRSSLDATLKWMDLFLCFA